MGDEDLIALIEKEAESSAETRAWIDYFVKDIPQVLKEFKTPAGRPSIIEKTRIAFVLSGDAIQTRGYMLKALKILVESGEIIEYSGLSPRYSLNTKI